jgi:hypothetical protein
MSINLNSFETWQATKSAIEKNELSFLGAVLDTGAAKSVIGKAHAMAYCKANNLRLSVTPSSASFRFADQVCKSLGKMMPLIPTPGIPIQLSVNVVSSPSSWS